MDMMRRVALLLAVLLCAHAQPASCAVTHMEVRPQEPVRGDVISVDLMAAPGETVDVQIRFRKALKVSGGRYLLELDGVEVPEGPNSFTVKATNVANLVVAVRLGIWISVSREADGGEASISQGGVLPGRYDVHVKGDAAPGAAEVTVEVTARTTVTAGSDGGYTVSYDTSPIPAGVFRVDAGGLSRAVTLREVGGPPSPPPSPPVAAFTVPSGVVAGQPALLDASASYDTDGAVVGYTWDMGDGAVLHGVTVTHTYAVPGLYAVALTVMDDAGLTGIRAERLLVADQPNRPPITLVSTNRTCFAGQTVGFSAHASSDPDGRIVSYAWDLGDGSTAEGAAATHRYASPGPRDVTLVVTDDDGLTAVARIRVEVLSPPEGLREWTELTAWGGGPLALPGGRGLLMLNASDGTPILFFMHQCDPHPDGIHPPGQVGGYLDLSAGDPDLVEWPLYVEVGYDAGSVTEAQAAELRLYRFSGWWLQCRDTGSEPARRIVWARLQRDELEGSALTIGGRPPIEGATVRALRLSSGSVDPGVEVTVQADVLNLLPEETSVALTLEVDGSPVSLRTLRLGPQDGRLVNFTLTLEEPGPHMVGVGGIAVPLVVESPGAPDLTVQGGFPERAEAGRPLAITFTVVNVGRATSPPFSVSLYAGEASASTLQLCALNPGESVNAEVTWTPNEPGPYSLRVLVDEGGLVPETDEGNNAMVGTVEVSERPAEDGWALVALSAVIVAAAGLSLHWRQSQSSLGMASSAWTTGTNWGSITCASTESAGSR